MLSPNSLAKPPPRAGPGLYSDASRSNMKALLAVNRFREATTEPQTEVWGQQR